MKILYFHQYFSTPRGATGTRSYEMSRYLAAEGHDVTVVCGSSYRTNSGLTGPFRRRRRAGMVDGVRVIELHVPYSNHDSLAKRSAAFLRFALVAIGLAMREDCDVIFASSTPLTAGVPGIIARWVRRTPFVFEVRDLWPELPREMGVIRNPVALKAMDWLEWVSYHSAERLVALSPGIADGIVRRGINRDRVSVIPNGSDLELFDSSGYDRRTIQISGIGDGDFVAAFTGAHGLANGLDAVLDAAHVLKARGRSDIKMVLVGDGALKRNLTKRASDQDLGNCLFLPPVPKEELARLLSRVDVGLMTLANVPAFYRGTSPNKFFDYIAAGIPVLNNYPGWLADMIIAHQCGIVVPPDDPIAFASALERLASLSPGQLKEMGANARSLAESHFSRHVLAAAFEEAVTLSTVGHRPTWTSQDRSSSASLSSTKVGTAADVGQCI